MVRADFEQPRREGKCRRVLVQSIECLGEDFHGQVFGIVGAEHHLIDHVKNGIAVALHQLAKCPLVVLLGHTQHERVIVTGFVGEIGLTSMVVFGLGFASPPQLPLSFVLPFP